MSEAEWRVLKVLLPVEREAGKRGRGRPPEDNRNIINGILWRLRCGTAWRDVPEKYGNWNSIYRRFRRWSASGIWDECGNRSRRDNGRERPLQHRQHNSSRPRLGGGRKRGAYRRALGRSRGRFTGKVHCLRDTPGEAADCQAYAELIDLPE